MSKTLAKLRKHFGNTAELIFFQSDSIIQARIKIFSSGKKGFHNYAFNFSEEEIKQEGSDIFEFKFHHAVKELKRDIQIDRI